MLSAIIPNYNHAAYLPHALDGLLAQTRLADEIIVIDDASSDDSIMVASGYAERYPSIRVLRNPQNLGVVGTLNRGLREARGDIVYCGASDDVTYPTLFERGLAMLDAYPQAALFSSLSDVIAEDGTPRGVFPTPLPLSEAGFIAPTEAARLLMRDDAWFMGNTSLYRLAPLLELGGFPADVGSLNDGYISRVLALRHGACFAPEVLASWRRLEGGHAWSYTLDRERRDRLVAAVMRKMSDAASPFPPGYPERWRRRFVFGAERFALGEARRHAATRGSSARLFVTLREAAVTAWLFLRLRPFDLLPVIQRRLRYALR
jgi:glycosyltransferase involved in cell wall biosynthesis